MEIGVMTGLESAACFAAPTIFSSVTGGAIGGVIGYVSSPLVASASTVIGISSNIMRNKNETVQPPKRISREWVCFTTAVGAGSGFALSIAYRTTAYGLGMLSNYLMG